MLATDVSPSRMDAARGADKNKALIASDKAGYLDENKGGGVALQQQTVEVLDSSVGFAPASCLGGEFLATPWEDVATALHVSAYSFKSLSMACMPLMGSGASVVGMDFDARQAWPAYDWMGVAKAALESVSRYLARDLGPRGIRVNLVAAGPVKTMAAKNIPGFEKFEEAWAGRAPLGWDVTDPTPVAKTCCALLSDWFPATTGSMVWVDGGFHAVGV